MDVVTTEIILDGTEYPAKPGLKYEVADGINVTSIRHTVALVEAVEKIASELEPKVKKKELHYLDVVLEQARLSVTVPDGFDWSRETVDSIVAQRVVDDFFTIAYVKSRLPKELLDRLAKAGENHQRNEAKADSG